MVIAVSFISLSPYFASWTEQRHWWVYGLLGVLISVLWLGILLWLWGEHPLAVAFAQNARVPVFISLALIVSATAAALVQPMINSQTSPIRAPLISPGWESQGVLLLFGFLALVGVAIGAALIFSRTIARIRPIPAGAYAVVVLLGLVYFLVFTLTKESTAALELALKLIGV